MGGNVWEWTTESYSSTTYPYAKRGGRYSGDFASGPAGSRFFDSDDANASYGFRLTLFM